MITAKADENLTNSTKNGSARRSFASFSLLFLLFGINRRTSLYPEVANRRCNSLRLLVSYQRRSREAAECTGLIAGGPWAGRSDYVAVCVKKLL